MVSRGTLGTLAYFRLRVPRPPSLLLRVPFPDPSLRSLFRREREINGVGECRGGGCVEGPACLVLFHLLSLISPVSPNFRFRISSYIEGV